MTEEASSQDSDIYDIQALEAVYYYLLNGRLPDGLTDRIRDHPVFQQVINNLEAIQSYSLALANGDLDTELKIKGRVAGSLKSLQASLRHLTWQTQQIAGGDLSQRVRFMGDFSTAFNNMVESLENSRSTLLSRAKELAKGREIAIKLLLDAQTAQAQAEAAVARLQEQIEENRRLEGQLQEQVIRDPLTGCFNRRYLVETIDREFARAEREGYPISILMADIDQFKLTNDTYGHMAGDAVLQTLGKLLHHKTRAGDIVCRYGGEEFLLVLSNILLADALDRAEEYRREIEDLSVDYSGIKLKITVSIGVAAYPRHGKTSGEVTEAADHALYQAKSIGRNRVCVTPG